MFYECDSRYRMLLAIGQSYIEGVMLRDLASRGVEVERSSSVVDFGLDFTDPTYPVIARIRNDVEEREEEIRAQFLIGCDGTHSFVRDRLGIRLEGENMKLYWGVIDAWFKTDLPVENSVRYLDLFWRVYVIFFFFFFYPVLIVINFQYGARTERLCGRDRTREGVEANLPSFKRSGYRAGPAHTGAVDGAREEGV